MRQLLSLIAQHGGVKAADAFRVLCQSGPFSNVTSADFAELLRGPGKVDLLAQAGDATLLCGQDGKRIVNHYSLYAAFQSSREFRLVHADHMLGMLPINVPLYVDRSLIFSGRRWRILAIHDAEKLIELMPAPSGRPEFGGETGGETHDRVRQQMRDLLSSARVPTFLDRQDCELLGEARVNFSSLRLHETSIVPNPDGKGAAIVAWAGDQTCEALALALRSLGIEVELFGPILTIEKRTLAEIQYALGQLAYDFPSIEMLTAQVKSLCHETFDQFVPESLLAKDYGVRRLDAAAGQAPAQSLMCGR